MINYTPPETVKNFIKHYLKSELFANWIIGPVGSGKTTELFFKLVYMASLQEPGADGIRRTRAVVVRNTMPQLKDTTIASWNYWFKDGVAGKWNATDKIFTLRFSDVECEVLFRALDTPDDISRVLSLEVTFAIFDEFVQIPKEIIEAVSGRCGRWQPDKAVPVTNWGMWGASNPGNEDDWWYAHLARCVQMSKGAGLAADAEAMRMDAILSGESETITNQFYFEQPSGFSEQAENVEYLPGGRGYYTNLVKGKSEHWIEQFIKGRWGFSLVGTPVLRSFNKDIHVARTALTYNPRMLLVGGYDPGVRAGALILGQQGFDGRLFITDELITQGGTERVVKERLMPLLRNKYAQLDWKQNLLIVPDPAAGSRTPTDERTVVQTLKGLGLKTDIVDPNNTLQPRIDAIEHFTTRLVEGKPALVIDPRCKVLIRALQSGWRYTTTRKGDASSVEPEKNNWSHPADAGCYLARYFHKGHMRKARDSVRGRHKQVTTNPYVLG